MGRDKALYIADAINSKIYKLPAGGSGKAGQPVDIWMNQLVKDPDGMRAANGKLLVAENGNGRISAIAVHGDKASVAVLEEGLNSRTAVEPAGDTIWVAERGAG